MQEIVSLMIVSLILVAVIGFLIGYSLGKNRAKKIILEEREKKDCENIGKQDNIKPFIIQIYNENEKKDNLKKIKGIDKIIEEQLNELGIFYFSQISAWNIRNCQWIENFLNLEGIVLKLKWVEQAKILQTGKETLFSINVD